MPANLDNTLIITIFTYQIKQTSINKQKFRAMKTIEEAVKYLRSLGLKEYVDFSQDASIEVIELNINRRYFCSIGEWDGGKWEVYELHHGAEVSETGEELLTDGELWQYKVYDSLKRAIDFALKCKKNNKLPDKVLKVW